MLAPVMMRCGLVNGYHSKYKKKDLTQKRTKSSLFFLFADKGKHKIQFTVNIYAISAAVLQRLLLLQNSLKLLNENINSTLARDQRSNLHFTAENALCTRCVFTSCQCFTGHPPMKTIDNYNELCFRKKSLSSRHQTQSQKIQSSFALAPTTKNIMKVDSLRSHVATVVTLLLSASCFVKTANEKEVKNTCKNSEKNKEWQKMHRETLFLCSLTFTLF